MHALLRSAPTYLIALVLLVVALGACMARFRRRVDTRRRLGPDGVVIGGGPIDLAGRADAPRLLLLHGGGDTPQTLAYLARSLAEHGYSVRAPLLPGHGRSLEEFGHVSADALYAAVRGAYRELTENGTRVVGVVGLSMGGALAVQLAADEPELPALCLLAPYLAMPRGIALMARLSRLWGPLLPVIPAGGSRSIHDPAQAAENLAYGAFTPGALRALHDVVMRARAALPRVAAPTLVIQSREDNRIAPHATQAAFDALGAHEKRLEWLTGSGHVVTVDYRREQVAADVAAWMDAHLSTTHAARGR